jgi:beta-lactamase regulating signal transducer with metallopeptidase domain
VGRAARLALTAAELETAVAHELAHRRAHDNLKRFLMLCAPDLFSATPAAERLESAWRAEAECLADGVAAGPDQERAATLASALVKVARLEHDRQTLCSPAWSTFYEPGILESRVRRLVASERPDHIRRRRSWPMLVGVAAAAAGTWLSGVPAALHGLTELAIQILP